MQVAAHHERLLPHRLILNAEPLRGYVAVAIQGSCSKLVAKWLTAGGLEAIPCSTFLEFEALEVACTVLEKGFSFDDAKGDLVQAMQSDQCVLVGVNRGPSATAPSGPAFVLP